MTDPNAPQDGVSVLLCSNKADDYMDIAVQSILAQQYENFELVIVANGQGAAAIQQKYGDADPRIRVVTTAFKGLTTNLNIGLYFCQHELIARMDADDIARPDRLAVQVRRFREDPRLTVCGSSYELIDLEGQFVKRMRLPLLDPDIRRAMCVRNPICHPSVMLRKAAVLKVGGYLTGLHAEDYDLWVRMAADPACVFENIDEPLIQYRQWSTESRGSAASYGTAMMTCAIAFLQGQGFGYLFGALAFSVKFLKARLAARVP
jgi:glycosyltransferase involved in cell wall biosynthesis